MRSFPRIAVLALALEVSSPVALFSRALPSYLPGVRPMLQGAQGTLGISDVSALYWNPAGLALNRGLQGYFSFAESFRIEYAGFSGFFPVIGTAAVAAGRQPVPSGSDFLAAGLGRSFFSRLHTGISLTNYPNGRTSYTALGIGAIWQPLDLAGAPTTTFPRWLAPLTVGLALQNLSLNPSYGPPHQISAVLAYALGRQGPRLSYGYTRQAGEGWHHLAAALAPLPWLTLMAGLEDFRSDGMATGLSVHAANIQAEAGYDFGRETAKIALSFDIGLAPRERSRRAQENAAHMLQQGDQRQALHYAEHALAYDPASSEAQDIIRTLSGRVRIQDSAIDSLLQRAQRDLQKRWYISAAVQYKKVLQIDPENRFARLALQTIAPNVAQYGERWYQNGRQLFERGDLKRAREVLISVRQVLPDHAGVREYLGRIDEQIGQKVQEYYFAGLGYYTQKKYFEAEEQFRKALSLNPEFREATEYVDRILAERKQNQKAVDHLLLEARRREEASDWLKALQLYRQILGIEPDFAYARKREAEMESKVTAYINQQYAKAEAAFNSGDNDTARKLLRAILDIRPGHTGALRYLEQLQPVTANKGQYFLDLSRRHFAQGRWEATLTALDSLSHYMPDAAEIGELRRKCYANLPIDRLIQIGRAGYLDGRYLEALEVIREALKKDPGRQDARDLAEQCESSVTRLVDTYFNRGLNYYTEEKYRAAIAEWNRALLINPAHQGSLEYKRRAQERLDALNQLP
ncbi:MAG TPA: tetratricopeptide repeat protein [bacterium]|nr:tetratricopeptide repeat protein [bacterium]HPR86782.1 tetratricopeptide repeat protein [bacterium]